MSALSHLLLGVLLRLIPFVLLGSVLGTFVGVGYGWMVVCIGLAWQMVSHLRHFARLSEWAARPHSDKSLEGQGAWDTVFGQLYRHDKLLNARIARRDEEIERFEAAGHALTDGVIMLDEQHHIEWCNATAEQQLGLMRLTDRGHPITNLVRRPELVNYLQNEDFAEPLVMRSDRADRVFSINLVPFAKNRRLMQVRDVTQADLLDQMRRDFVANVSHELRTPLTVLAGFVETLQELELSPEEQKRYLSMMGDQSMRMQAIVQDLLTLSAMESAPPPESSIVDMASLINKLHRDAKVLSSNRHQIELLVESNRDLLGSETELVSAFTNLVSNAVRYTPEGGKVLIGWVVHGHGAEFYVQDSGIGIDAKHIPRLTERFYRIDRGRSRDAGGTGLGLAIVKHALQRHDARLAISSKIGQGSRFGAIFPVQRLV